MREWKKVKQDCSYGWTRIGSRRKPWGGNKFDVFLYALDALPLLLLLTHFYFQFISSLHCHHLHHLPTISCLSPYPLLALFDFSFNF